MNLLAPVARPLFTWNSRGVMLRAGEGLAGFLGVRLVGAEFTARPGQGRGGWPGWSGSGDGLAGGSQGKVDAAPLRWGNRAGSRGVREQTHGEAARRRYGGIKRVVSCTT